MRRPGVESHKFQMQTCLEVLDIGGIGGMLGYFYMWEEKMRQNLKFEMQNTLDEEFLGWVIVAHHGWLL